MHVFFYICLDNAEHSHDTVKLLKEAGILVQVEVYYSEEHTAFNKLPTVNPSKHLEQCLKHMACFLTTTNKSP
jgi:dTDP-4-amino-4,6-dideoxygalactose transaminase